MVILFKNRALSRIGQNLKKGQNTPKMSKIEGNRGFLRNTQKSKILQKGQKPSILVTFRGIFRIPKKGQNPHFLRFSRKVTKHPKNGHFDGFWRILSFHSFAISLFHKQRIPLNFFSRKATHNQKREKKSPEVTSILSVLSWSKTPKNQKTPLQNPKKCHFRKRIPIFPRWFFCKRRGKDADFFCTSCKKSQNRRFFDFLRFLKKWLFGPKWPFLRIPQKGPFSSLFDPFWGTQKRVKKGHFPRFWCFSPFLAKNEVL